MEKPLIVFSNVPAFKEWPTKFKLLFQALLHMHCYELANNTAVKNSLLQRFSSFQVSYFSVLAEYMNLRKLPQLVNSTKYFQYVKMFLLDK